MIQEIYVIDDEKYLTKDLKSLVKNDKNLTVKGVNTANLDEALKSIPELIVINEDCIGMEIEELCKQIRANEDNSITPIIVISSNNDNDHALKIIKNNVEYFISRKLSNEYVYHTIKNITRLMYVNRRVSPLTGLPGNVQIQTELKKRLMKRKTFEVLYFDLDNFKAYNDVYGFVRGDEIIQLTAKIITKNIHSINEGEVFVGHIGGDDFVAILDGDVDYNKVCQDIIAEFDIEVIKHFNEEDVERGYLEVQNRKGVMEQMPLTAISIGVVVADEKRFMNILEIGEIGAQVKHLAKTTLGSSYAIDRREQDINK